LFSSMILRIKFQSELDIRIVDFNGEPETLIRQVRTHRCLFPLISYHTLLRQLNGGYIQLTMSLRAVTLFHFNLLRALRRCRMASTFRGREAEALYNVPRYTLVDIPCCGKETSSFKIARIVRDPGVFRPYVTAGEEV